MPILDSILLSILLQIPLWAFVLLMISRTPLATAQQDLDIDDEGGGGGGLLDGLEGEGENEQELALQEEKRKSKTAINLHVLQRVFCRSSYFNAG